LTFLVAVSIDSVALQISPMPALSRNDGSTIWARKFAFVR
jgi:hypothetical protein